MNEQIASSNQLHVSIHRIGKVVAKKIFKSELGLVFQKEICWSSVEQCPDPLGFRGGEIGPFARVGTGEVVEDGSVVGPMVFNGAAAS